MPTANGGNVEAFIRVDALTVAESVDLTKFVFSDVFRCPREESVFGGIA